MTASKTEVKQQEPRLAIDLAVATLLLCAIAYLWRTALTPDGVAYFENAQLLARGHFAEAVQGYWSPGYSLLLVPVAWIAGENRDVFLAIAHVVQALLCALALRLVVVAVEKRVPAQARYAVFWACAWVLLVWLTQELLTPDLLLAVLVLLFMTRLPARAPRDQIVLGVIAGAGFLTKTSIWPWLAVALAIAALRARRSGNRGDFPSLCVAVAALVVAPYVITISMQAGHPTLGSVGPLNARWYLGDVSRRLPDMDNGPHELKKQVVLTGGEQLSYIDLRRETRTYAPWSDPERWARGVPAGSNSPFHLGEAMRSWKENGRTMLFSILPIVVILAAGVGLGGLIRQPLFLTGLAAALIFAIVHVENRLLAPAALLMLIGAWQQAALEKASARFVWCARLATAASLLAIAFYMVRTPRRAISTKANLDGLHTALGHAMERDHRNNGVVIDGSGTLWMPSLWRRHLRVAVQFGGESAIRLRYFQPDERSEILHSWFGADAIGMGEAYLVKTHGEFISFWAFRPW